MLHIIWNFLTNLFVSVILVGIVLGVWVGYFYDKKSKNLKGKHVMITGGSSGIGKYLAIEVVKLGGNVSIVARNPNLLEEARLEILKFATSPDQKVSCISVDVSGPYDQVEHAIAQAEEELGPIFVLANNAGYSRAAKFEDTPIEEIKRMMSVNYFGAAQFTHAVVASMKGRQEGAVLFVSSQAGLMGVYGFGAYSASKFALRGLAESLSMELKPYKVTVTLGFPPDTDTPGYVEENKDKPEETRLISEASGLQSPECVAKMLMKDCLKGNFMSSVGFEGFMQSTVCIGMAPVTSVVELFIQAFSMGIIRLVSAGYLYKFDRIVVKCMENRNQKKRPE